MPWLPFSVQLAWGTALSCRVTAALCASCVGAESSFTGAEKWSGTSGEGSIKTTCEVAFSGLVLASHSSSCRHFFLLCMNPSSLDTCPYKEALCASWSSSSVAQELLGCVETDGVRSCTASLHLPWMRMEVFRCDVG